MILSNHLLKTELFNSKMFRGISSVYTEQTKQYERQSSDRCLKHI